jgi:DNA-binding XRE family transcriptional regulator
MARNFRELERKMQPASVARAKSRAHAMLQEMLLAELRKTAGLSQDELAEALGIKQPTLSRLESQDDMQISTLRRVIEALGGELEIIARLPSGDVRLSQFQEAS